MLAQPMANPLPDRARLDQVMGHHVHQVALDLHAPLGELVHHAKLIQADRKGLRVGPAPAVGLSKVAKPGQQPARTGQPFLVRPEPCSTVVSPAASGQGAVLQGNAPAA